MRDACPVCEQLQTAIEDAMSLVNIFRRLKEAAAKARDASVNYAMVLRPSRMCDAGQSRY
jgi:hypothetical protein